MENIFRAEQKRVRYLSVTFSREKSIITFGISKLIILGTGMDNFLKYEYFCKKNYSLVPRCGYNPITIGNLCTC